MKDLKNLLNSINQLINLKGLLFLPVDIYFFFRNLFFLLISKNERSHIGQYGDREFNFRLYPCFADRSKVTNFDAHYYYQEYWAVKYILKNNFNVHHDFASQINLSKIISLHKKTFFHDIRPLKGISLNNLTIMKTDLMSFSPKMKIDSASCLHVIEHIGLGRYGDKPDYFGDLKALDKLGKSINTNGFLYLSLPIGKQSIYFDAHRVYDPQILVQHLSDKFSLVHFSSVNDKGKFKENDLYTNFKNAHYSLGMFIFKKT
ncbi:DUF268 domain-containing protein [Methylophilaceae bacterium Uisw_097]